MNIPDPLCSEPLRVVLAVDPGKDQGWAVFRANALIDCGLGQIPAAARCVDVLVLEKPWIRPQVASVVNPNDLIELAIHMTEARLGLSPKLRIAYRHLEYYYPHEWKGSANKEQIELRVLPSLYREERDILRRGWDTTTESRQHNVTEAVGLGLHHLRRLR